MTLRNPGRFSEFSRWIHERERLRTADGVNVMDIDKVLHKFCHWENGRRCRDVQAMMFLETKVGAERFPDSQKDTLYMIHQIFRTSFQWQRGIEGRLQMAHKHDSRRAWARIAGKVVEVKFYGVFLLRMPNGAPRVTDVYEWSMPPNWTPKVIDFDTLYSILAFERHPVSLLAGNPARPRKKVLADGPDLF